MEKYFRIYCPSLEWDITRTEVVGIERAQKVAIQIIILGVRYDNCRNGLEKTYLDTLKTRRAKLHSKFVIEADKNNKYCKLSLSEKMQKFLTNRRL